MEGSWWASVFMEGSRPSLPISWATQEESIEELQHRLVCTTMELQTTGEAAKVQRKLNEVKLGHLQDLLDATKKERDEAFQERKKLQECLLHLSYPQQAAIASESPCTTSSCGQLHHQHPLSCQDLDSSCFLHNFKPKPMQTFSQTHDLQPILCLSEGLVSSLQEPQQFCLDFSSEDKAFKEDLNFGDLQEQFSMDLLIEDMAFDEDESLDLTDLQVDQPLNSNWADLSMKSSWESHLSSQSSSISSADSQVQSGTDGEKALAMSAHTPTMSSAQLQAVSSSQSSVMARKASSSPAMSMSASLFTETVKKDMPSSAMSCLQRPAMSASQSAAMAKKAMPSSTMSSPCIPAISASHSSAMAMPSGAMSWLHIPAKAASQYSSMAKEGILSSAMLSPHMPAMSVSPSSTMAKKALLSLAMALPHLPAMPLAMPSSQASRTAAKKAYQLPPTSILPQKRLHLPEPPEANIDVMLSSLPEKGKLLEAVMRAGPLLQQLLLAGPLPHWQHPPPKLNTMDIPKVPKSPKSVLLPWPHVQNVPSCMPPNNKPTGSSFLCTMKGISPCLLPTSGTAKSSMHLNHNPSNSYSKRRKLPRPASRGVR